MGLMRIIREDPDARKMFGQRELKIIEKQLLGVSLTQSEKNRLSRDIRKKLEFISRAARFQEEFRLKKGAEIKKIIEDTKQMILEDPLAAKINAIYLYGSAVENKLTLESDIDIAVSLKTDTKDATLFRKRMMGKSSSRVDIQVFENLPEKLRKEIKTKGNIIYLNENTRQD